MLTRPSFKKSLIVEQFQGNYLKENFGIFEIMFRSTSRYKPSVLVLKNAYFLFLFTASKSRYFVWTEDHDVLMLREAVTSEPYNLNRKAAREGKYGKALQPILILPRLQSSGLQRGQ